MKKTVQKFLDSKTGAIVFLLLALPVGIFRALFRFKKFKEHYHFDPIPKPKLYFEKDTVFITIYADKNSLKIVSGDFYEWAQTEHVFFETAAEVRKKLQSLAKKCLAEGFTRLVYVKSLRNSNTYDDIEWHEPATGLPEFNAHIPFGMFLGWMIANGFTNDELLSETFTSAFKNGTMTGAQVYEAIGGKLTKEEFTREGNRFCMACLEQYTENYKALVAADCDSIFAAADTPTNFAIISDHLDSEYAKFKFTS